MRRFSKITTTQLARICGVSQGTVDRALHNRGEISQATKERILAVAKEYDYVPNVKGSEAGNSMLIGVVLFDLYNEFFSKLAMSLVNAAKQVGYSVIFQFSGKDMQAERDAIEYFHYIGVDGIILFSVGSDSEEYGKYLDSLTKPLVLIGNQMFDLPYIGIDDEQAMYDLTLEFVKGVCKDDIVYYAPVLKKALHATNAQKLRERGFVGVMKMLGRSYRIVTEIEQLSDFGGLICATDYYALSALKHLGYPEDIRIAGFDNVSFLKNLPSQILTAEYSTDQIARECMNYIFGKRFCSCIGHRIVSNQ